MQLQQAAVEIESSELFIKVLSEPHLCMLLNPDLTQAQIQGLKETFHIVQIEHNKEWYNAVVLGYYKPKSLSENPETLAEGEAKIIDFWSS